MTKLISVSTKASSTTFTLQLLKINNYENVIDFDLLGSLDAYRTERNFSFRLIIPKLIKDALLLFEPITLEDDKGGINFGNFCFEYLGLQSENCQQKKAILDVEDTIRKEQLNEDSMQINLINSSFVRILQVDINIKLKNVSFTFENSNRRILRKALFKSFEESQVPVISRDPISINPIKKHVVNGFDYNNETNVNIYSEGLIEICFQNFPPFEESGKQSDFEFFDKFNLIIAKLTDCQTFFKTKSSIYIPYPKYDTSKKLLKFLSSFWKRKNIEEYYTSILKDDAKKIDVNETLSLLGMILRLFRMFT